MKLWGTARDKLIEARVIVLALPPAKVAAARRLIRSRLGLTTVRDDTVMVGASFGDASGGHARPRPSRAGDPAAGGSR
ncbi:MAG TPA: hypothetical protein VH858_08865 [Hyphomicrobiales bacterium]